MAQVRLVPWSDEDFELLKRSNTPEMTVHLGGPETDEQLIKRHQKNLDTGDSGQMCRVVLEPTGEVVGSAGYWERTWNGELVYETGYGILPEFQGRGLAVAALREIVRVAGEHGTLRWVHAYPKVLHVASNEVCRKAGFELVGEVDFEYPKGNPIRCNDWRAGLTR